MRKSVGNINFAMDNLLMNKLIGACTILGRNYICQGDLHSISRLRQL